MSLNLVNFHRHEVFKFFLNVYFDVNGLINQRQFIFYLLVVVF